MPPAAARCCSKQQLKLSITYLPADDDDRREHVPETGERLVAPRDVPERRRRGLQAVDERQDRLHPFGRHFCSFFSRFLKSFFSLSLRRCGRERGGGKEDREGRCRVSLSLSVFFFELCKGDESERKKN